MIFLEDSSDSEEEAKLLNIVSRRNLRDSSNIFDLPTEQFTRFFRVNKNCFLMILRTIDVETKRMNAVPAIIQVAATLNLLASGSYEVNVGSNKFISMAQSTVSKTFRNTLKLLEEKFCPSWIKMSEANFEDCRKYFYQKYKLPGIVGVVDGTHIPILRPKENEHIFFNRKGFHSLNVMIICNHKNEIIAVDATNGGAAHDSAIWNKSNDYLYFFRKYEEGNTSIRILGDSGYPLQPWMLTPYRDATDQSPEMRFNNIHAKARSIIERTIGILKGRWRCLSSDRRLRFSPEQVAKIVNVCAALHNACIFYKVEVNEGTIQMVNENDSSQEDFTSSTILNGDSTILNGDIQRKAKLIRDNIRDNL